MLWNKHAAHSRKRTICCLLLALMMLLTVQMSLAEEAPPVQPPAESADPVQEAGAQLRTGPVLMVTDYTVVEGDKIPGSSFVMEMTIANLSETSSAHNVMATLTIENVSVALQEGFTNQIYYHEILPQQTVTARFPLEVYSYCSEENMILAMTMTCYDDAAVHYDFQTMMTPDVDVARMLHVSSLSVPQFVHRNSSMNISATLTNPESVNLMNVQMHIVTQHGETVTEVKQLLKGESVTIDGIYRFPEQQTEKVQVYFTYESLTGHHYATDPRSFEVVVYDPAGQDGFAADSSLSLREMMERLTRGTAIPGTGTSLPVPVGFLILAGCVGYVVVLCSVLRKKRR